MTKEYIYDPYVFKSDPNGFPPKIRGLLSDNTSVYMNMSYTLKKLAMWSRNELEQPEILIRSIDYFICNFLFPLEAHSVYWEIHHKLIQNLLDEERRLFDSLGYLDKEDLYYQVKYRDEPDLNQMYTRLTLYSFYAAWYSKSLKKCKRISGYLAEECFYDIAHLIDKEEADSTKDMTEDEKIKYLTELTNWISMESDDGRYGEYAIDFYEDLLEFFENYKAGKIEKDLFSKIHSIVLKDYKDVLITLIVNNEEKIERLEEKLGIRTTNNKFYHSLINKCNEILYLMEGGEGE